ncbi:TM0106 family RecB-like putative nuclease [Haloechinothrix sp. LS1_15]|uniref:TM0106 family RecB-like putative nuclease n=1 Tax=Haloechinothrix sp. LS1_15 TaxID=2652248 RepID=UPI0029469C34|nr:TM0106 family RecB-like putative nuclease [Haloechinothrix sp. LS1_15]MDV6010881.1 TM0106 family RecB-like putative nuclease [Haloechinothrix sp. LS1_15]
MCSYAVPAASDGADEPEVLLDAGAVTRCRRRVHLEHDPNAPAGERLPLDAGTKQRIADARAHREEVTARLRDARGGAGWVTVRPGAPPTERVAATEAALAESAEVISGALLPSDGAGGRRGGSELLVRTGYGYVPIIVVRHKVTDPCSGPNAARTTPFGELDPERARPDSARKLRSQPRDQLRLAHLLELLRAAGYAETGRALGGVIGVDADVIVWHDLTAPTFPGGLSALDEYRRRFADRLAVATAAATGATPLAQPSRVLECRSCPWWSVCERDLLRARDVSLVVRGDDAVELRKAGVATVDDLAALDPNGQEPVLVNNGTNLGHLVALAQAWCAGHSVVRKVDTVRVARADVEVDVDMESYSDRGAYLWGALLSGADIGVARGYHAFATWEPLPDEDEARSFAEFWAWFREVRERAAARGLSFRAYCYNARAENRWLLSSAQRFAGRRGIPTVDEVDAFVGSEQWVDLFRAVSDSFLCVRGKGLKVIAPLAGFSWRDPDASGEASMQWYREAVGLDTRMPDRAQRGRLMRYNEDDVRATAALREWMSGPAMTRIPHMDSLASE